MVQMKETSIWCCPIHGDLYLIYSYAFLYQFRISLNMKILSLFPDDRNKCLISREKLIQGIACRFLPQNNLRGQCIVRNMTRKWHITISSAVGNEFVGVRVTCAYVKVQSASLPPFLDSRLSWKEFGWTDSQIDRSLATRVALDQSLQLRITPFRVCERSAFILHRTKDEGR